MGANKTTLISGSLIRNMGFIIEFIMELSSIVTFMSFTVFKDSLGLESPFTGVVNEPWEGKRVLTSLYLP